ncbi:MAG: lytic murein transglycosylase, partial [Gammaproteobacteria bacterium]|nr:lytic murein transglycosylase [Gammaproteobacteria bacterium]
MASRARPCEAISRLRAVFGLLAALFAVPVCAQPVDPQRAQVRAALEAAERGAFDAAAYAYLASHPLYGWIEYAALRRNIDVLSNAQGQAFLSRYRGQAVAEAFREIWLPALARREDWAAFRAAWAQTIDSTALRCAELNARQAIGTTDARWVSDAQALWRSTGKALPGACDAPFAALAVQGGLPPALRWERIERAAAEWEPAAMRSA